MEFEQRGAPAPAVEEVEVECAVRGIYPQPKIAVTWSDRCEFFVVFILTYVVDALFECGRIANVRVRVRVCFI